MGVFGMWRGELLMVVFDLVLNDTRFEITEDEHTGDWGVMNLDERYPQPFYVRTKMGAINFCLVEASMVKRSEVEYQMAPDRTSA